MDRPMKKKSRISADSRRSKGKENDSVYKTLLMQDVSKALKDVSVPGKEQPHKCYFEAYEKYLLVEWVRKYREYINTTSLQKLSNLSSQDEPGFVGAREGGFAVLPKDWSDFNYTKGKVSVTDLLWQVINPLWDVLDQEKYSKVNKYLKQSHGACTNLLGDALAELSGSNNPRTAKAFDELTDIFNLLVDPFNPDKDILKNLKAELAYLFEQEELNKFGVPQIGKKQRENIVANYEPNISTEDGFARLEKRVLLNYLILLIEKKRLTMGY